MTDIRTTPIESRFWSKVHRTPTCWEWLGGKKHGYGYFYIAQDKPRVRAHKWLFERFVSLIPPGFELHHLCDNASCVRPSHLQALTRRAHVHQGNNAAAQCARRTHCPKGHAYNAGNTRIYRDGKRRCKLCEHERSRRRWKEQRGGR